ncbi:Zinc finger MYM-type protein 1-like isoform X1 [Oopsacas minuta]|uniref:Zinc finger MYM-type protein 1-like isoform X1 n=1 Tax=Oopsacas minuta TaxID=111878 RepID=A0AAV7JEV7_9METZ|nr:Zinc finger MYM-type protein 1-like isoform X1 [Oopsacas minuta]
MALARWLVQKAQSGSGETDKDSSLLPDNEQMQLLRTEGESFNEIQLTHRTRQPDIHIPQNATQSILSFPLRTFGKQQRGFNLSWYKTFPWLHYQEGSDSVLCFYCLVADKHGLKISGYMGEMFTSTGFSNWKKQ